MTKLMDTFVAVRQDMPVCGAKQVGHEDWLLFSKLYMEIRDACSPAR